MASEMSDEEYEFIMWWKIENYRYCWQKCGKEFSSPIFVATSMENTKWRLLLYPAGVDDKRCIGFFLQREEVDEGPDSVEINFVLEFLRSNGSVLVKEYSDKTSFRKSGGLGFPKFVGRTRVMQLEGDPLLPLNILTVRCRVCRCENRGQECVQTYAKTVINFEKISFVWAVEKFSSLKLDQRIPFEMKSTSKEVFMDVCIYGFMEVWKFFPMGISFEGIISTKIELTVPQIESVDIRSVPKINISKKQLKNARSLGEDFETLFTDGTLSDIKLCTETESFPAHSAVLCARSPVFKAMFSDDMKEKIKGSVDIIDLDDDTVRRMLLYMYTDSFEDLQWESAIRLYRSADKYEILSLRGKCSAFLKENLSLTNACDALVLADKHQDKYFKEAVQKCKPATNYVFAYSKYSAVIDMTPETSFGRRLSI
ncbi:TD and POZ domain-containing protein 3 [Trichonephila clavata]|uniref:TD and POZ domain-containing protein 3 n=1 Tax=Trichonephila clavata TaxID=2740835 RepID=A0A8X6FI97_TRICU|nr:TD and POZ domain-containing protein 3 [Trichonephila clavata]